MERNFDMAIIGGGPGGYVAALRGAQLGKRVILLEKDRLGGTCMNWGCIPAKFLLHQTRMFAEVRRNKNLKGPVEALECDWSAVQEERAGIVERFVRGIEFLLKKNGVTLVQGKGVLKDRNRVEVEEGEGGRFFLEAGKIILALGSRPASLPFARPDGKDILTSREALELKEIPGEMVIIGAGAIGLEMGVIFQRLGVRVTVLEILPRILPGCDREMGQRLERLLKAGGLRIFTGMEIRGISRKEGRMAVEGVGLRDQKPFSFSADKILLAVGRKPNSEDLAGLDSALVDEKGFVRADERLETKMPGVYAIGDLRGGMLLAHKASHEGVAAAENACGQDRHIRYEALPMAVYTEPELASAGLTEEGAREQGIEVQVGRFSLQANGRALTVGHPEGMVKILADREDKVVGAHILAPNASELMAEVALCMEKGLRLEDLFSSWHIHPTLSEAVMEAAMKAKGRALHVLNT